MFIDDDNHSSIETMSCLTATSIVGLHEYITWYIKEASTPPIDQIDCMDISSLVIRVRYVLGVLMSIDK
jgi:hypothetical protein